MNAKTVMNVRVEVEVVRCARAAPKRTLPVAAPDAQPATRNAISTYKSEFKIVRAPVPWLVHQLSMYFCGRMRAGSENVRPMQARRVRRRMCRAYN